MELFIKVYLWLAVINVVVKILAITTLPYPRVVSKESESLSLLILLPFMIWAAVLHWT